MPKHAAFCGLGVMGAAMAPNLAKLLAAQGAPPLLVWNRNGTKSKALVEELQSQGIPAQQAETLQQVAKEANFVFMMLAADAAVHAVVTGILEAPDRKVEVIIDHSTVLPNTTTELAAAAAVQGIEYLAGPVLGRPDAAAAARLLIFAGGSSHAKEQVGSLLGSMSRRVLDLGAEPKAAHTLKLVANFQLAAAMESIAEGMTLAEKNGISRETYLEFFQDAFPAPILMGYAGRMSRDEFAAGQGFTVALGLKDVGHMRQMAADSGCSLPSADLVHSQLSAAAQMGHSAKDWSALSLPVRKAAGMQ